MTQDTQSKLVADPALRAELEQVKRLVAQDSPLSHDFKVAIAGQFIAKLLGQRDDTDW